VGGERGGGRGLWPVAMAGPAPVICESLWMGRVRQGRDRRRLRGGGKGGGRDEA